MENASKALLIAGAILIVIVLISIGMLIVNSTNDGVDVATDIATSQAAQSFNSQFTKYAGTKVKGSTVKSLYETVVAANATATTSGGHTVNMSATSSVKNSATYSVTVTDTDSDGYVDSITWTENSSETPTTDD